MKIPEVNIDLIRDHIKYLDKLDYKKVTLKDIMPSLNQIFHGYVIACPVFSYPIRIFRSVKWNERPTNLNQLIHPPANYIKKMGRVNEIGVSYFYGSFNWEPTLFELRVEEGDYVALSLFETKSDLIAMPIGFMDGVFNRLKSNRIPPPEARPTNIDLTQRPSNKIVDEFISDSFTQIVEEDCEYKYIISVAIAKYFMSNPDADGIIYPAISMKADSENIALKPNTVLNKLKLTNCIYAKVGKNNGLFYDFIPEFISNRYSDSGDLLWAKVNLHKNENGQTIIEGMY